MSPTLPFLALAGITLLLGLLPFLPALIELWRKTDARPLRVARDHDGNIRHFARGFRSYMQSQLPGSTTTRFLDDTSIEGELQDGTPFLKSKGGVEAILPPNDAEGRLTQKILLTSGPMVLPDSTGFSREFYATDTVFGGEGNVYRAFLGEKEVLLAPRSMVLRWLHAEGKVCVGRESTLYGRVSSEHLISLGENCHFERLHAPRIEFGPAPKRTANIWHAGPLKPLFLHSVADVAGRRWLIQGDLEIPADCYFEGDLVATGRVRVGAGARIAGSLKSHKDMEIEEGSEIEGAVVSARDLRVGTGCRVRGPVVAEREITILSDNQIGAAECPTTISAPCIHVSPGVLAFGTVWAREMGRIQPSG